MDDDKSFSDFEEWFSDLDDKIQKLPEKQKAVKEGIIVGKTTGDLFKDWAIVMHSPHYKKAFESVKSLNTYLSGKTNELFLISEQEEYSSHENVEYCMPPPRHTTHSETIGVLSGRGLVIRRHPGLDAKVVSEEEAEKEQWAGLARHFQLRDQRHAKEQPLLVCLDILQGSKVYSGDYWNYCERLKLPVEIAPHIIPTLKLSKRGYYESYTHNETVEILAGTDIVIKYLSKRTINDHDMTDVKTPDDLFKILNKK